MNDVSNNITTLTTRGLLEELMAKAPTLDSEIRIMIGNAEAVISDVSVEQVLDTGTMEEVSIVYIRAVYDDAGSDSEG